MDPAEIKEHIEALSKEVMMLHVRWKYYEQLFLEPLNAASLHMASPSASAVIENAMFMEIVLGLARLVGGPSNRKIKGAIPDPTYARLTLGSFEDKIPDTNKLALFIELMESIKTKTADLRKWRDNKFAHNDVNTMLERVPELPAVKLDELRDAIADSAKAMNILNGHFLDVHMSYGVQHFDGAKLIAAYLRLGMEVWEEDKEKGEHDRWFRIMKFGKYGENNTPFGLTPPL